MTTNTDTQAHGGGVEAVRGQLPIWAEDGIAGRLSAAMHAYLAEYVFSPDDGSDHDPTDFERMIMEDMLNGALSAPAVTSLLQDAAFAALAASPAAPAPAAGVDVKQRWALARKLYEARYPKRGAGCEAVHWDALPKAERRPWLTCAEAAAPDAGVDAEAKFDEWMLKARLKLALRTLQVVEHYLPAIEAFHSPSSGLTGRQAAERVMITINELSRAPAPDAKGER